MKKEGDEETIAGVELFYRRILFTLKNKEK
jgi:hypothetical protein